MKLPGLWEIPRLLLLLTVLLLAWDARRLKPYRTRANASPAAG
jgi:hypothetical protein